MTEAEVETGPWETPALPLTLPEGTPTSPAGQHPAGLYGTNE